MLADYQGHTIKGGFYEYELLNTNFPQTYLGEKILRRRGTKVYVKWLGFSSDHNSWINSENIS